MDKSKIEIFSRMIVAVEYPLCNHFKVNVNRELFNRELLRDLYIACSYPHPTETRIKPRVNERPYLVWKMNMEASLRPIHTDTRISRLYQLYLGAECVNGEAISSADSFSVSKFSDMNNDIYVEHIIPRLSALIDQIYNKAKDSLQGEDKVNG